MTDIITTILASILEDARARMFLTQDWSDPASGFAFRMLAQTGNAKPGFMADPPAPVNAAYFRRTPHLAAYGYVIDKCDGETRAAWLEGIEHLRGREIYPADRQSFIFNPIEILGVAAGLKSCASATDHCGWFADTILRGFNAGHFRTQITAIAAQTALKAVASAKAAQVQNANADLETLGSADLVLAIGIDLAFGGVTVDPASFEVQLIKTLMSQPVAINDAAEATTISIVLQRFIDRVALGSPQATPTDRIVSLCRRFPVFVERIQNRQRGRAGFGISDEYDVQDLLHAILRLHFDDVRPEEHTPSYAGNSSRVDFYLPLERIVVEAKMTRRNLGQKEVTDELIIDAARYSKMDAVDTLICLIYDPQRYCSNPKTVENDVESTGTRLKVRAIVCPHGL